MPDPIRSSRPVLGVAVLLALAAGSAPGTAAARNNEPEREVVDARLENYPQNVTLEGGSTAFSWMMFVILTIFTVSILFKNSARTHLD